MEKPLWYRWARVYATGGVIILTGVLLFKYTTPTEEQLIASLSPELRSQYEKEKGLRRREQEELIKIVKQTAASNDPIWMTGPIKSPWDKDNKLENLKEKYEKELAEKKQLAELDRVRAELEEAQEKTRKQTDENMKKKHWFNWR
ncbi:CYFA0S05e00826g1_1 [Cyberlindnera fabianii]|uniref:Cytochrome b mRNA-processing protein 4 n=1 Tax=Cyberlindnera fabianii TaxID=36022 RepID=A0A061AS46_CYBFA|nr:Assembly factor CBP4 [Cyberlindnera fabianii]CDR40463.1 CYFA0S05e00826g1_1 [Cyberlindnera fabianii]